MKNNKYKTILHIADFGSPYPGNFIASLDALEKDLNKEDIKIIYIFPNRAMSRKWVKELLENKKIFFLSGNPIKDIYFIANILKKYDVDIVHTHFCWLKYNLITKIANLPKKAKIVRHVHSKYIDIGSDIYSRFRRWIFDADALAACSNDVYNGLITSGFDASKTHLVNNCIDFDRLDNYEEIKKVDLGISEDKVTVLMFGYNFYVKGVDIAIKAIDKLNKQYNNGMCLLLPLANNVDDVKIKIKETLGEFPVWIKILSPRNDIATYINVSDIFLSTSRSEGLPYALLENCYSKKIIIYSDIQVHCDLGFKYAIPFKSEDYLELFNILKTYMNGNVVITGEQLEEQKKIVLDKYSLNIWVEQIKNVYETVMED